MDIEAYRAMKVAGTLPRKGDKVRPKPGRGDHIGVGLVVDTFYQNGEGGMHVRFEYGSSWACCTDVDVVERHESVKTL